MSLTSKSCSETDSSCVYGVCCWWCIGANMTEPTPSLVTCWCIIGVLWLVVYWCGHDSRIHSILKRSVQQHVGNNMSLNSDMPHGHAKCIGVSRRPAGNSEGRASEAMAQRSANNSAKMLEPTRLMFNN